MKRILIATGIFSPDIGGPASYAKTLASHVAAGNTATVLTYSSVRHSAGDAQLGFRVVRVWNRWPKGLKHLIYFAQAIRLAKSHDVVYALNAASAGLPARLAARLYSRKFVVKIVGDIAWERAINTHKTSLLINDFQNVPRSGWIRMLHTIQFQVCKGAHRVIVPSEYLAGIVAVEQRRSA